MDSISTLNVYLHDDKIGTLHLLPSERIIYIFDDDYINNNNRPTLSLSFKNNFGDLITNIKPTRTRLPTFFSNLLPEGHMRDYLAERAGVNVNREFYLLKALGNDLPGAIRVLSDSKTPKKNKATKLILNPNDKSLHFSLAGVQLKFSAIMECSGGLTIPSSGAGGNYIIKLPSIRFKSVPENEYSMMQLAKLIGLNVPETNLVNLNDIKGLPNDLNLSEQLVLSVKRFDRDQNKLIHTEDFAQVFGVYPEDKYKKASYRNIAEVLWNESSQQSMSELIKIIVFNTLVGNADMHLKNFSLIYQNKQVPELAPGYDFVSTIAYMPDENMALKLIKSKKMTDLTINQLEAFANKIGLPKKLVTKTVSNTVIQFKEVWKKEKKHLPLTSKTIKIIESHAKTIPVYQLF